MGREKTEDSRATRRGGETEKRRNGETSETGIRGRRTEGRGQRAEGRGQKTEIRGRKTGAFLEEREMKKTMNRREGITS
jgi:hypothetical protein